MTQIDKTNVENILRTYIDPNHGVDLVTAKSVKKIVIDGANVSVFLELV
jgi:ATP-binding protein involved in chromosome partitioning